jgi:hypothetical protein
MTRFIGLEVWAWPKAKYGPTDRPAEVSAMSLMNRRRENTLSRISAMGILLFFKV